MFILNSSKRTFMATFNGKSLFFYSKSHIFRSIAFFKVDYAFLEVELPLFALLSGKKNTLVKLFTQQSLENVCNTSNAGYPFGNFSFSYNAYRRDIARLPNIFTTKLHSNYHTTLNTRNTQ